MTTFSGMNGITYGNHFLDICPNQLTKEVKKENPDIVTNVDNCEESQLIIELKEEEPEVDIEIYNVVCSFNVRCHLNLRQIALNGANVEYRREHGMVTMKIRRPYTTASIWSSGKITCTGATSNEDAKVASRKFARILQQLGFRVRFTNYRIVNVLGTCSLPFGIKISQFAEKYRSAASYEPELHPGATYKIKELKATLKIFTTGNITITAPSIQNVQEAVVHIYPLVFEFKKEKPPAKVKPLKHSRYSYHNHSKSNASAVTKKAECIKYESFADENNEEMEFSDHAEDTSSDANSE